MRKYVLEGHTAVPVDSIEDWGKMFEYTGNRIVKQQHRGAHWISTVFLGLDHSWNPNGPPQLFETMVFDRSNRTVYNMGGREWKSAGEEEDCRRCSTWEQAEQQHRETVERLRWRKRWATDTRKKAIKYARRLGKGK